jgi:hypothetical protein
MERMDEFFKRHFQFDPMYGLALLKVSHDLRSSKHPGFEEILEDTLTDFRIDQRTFERYVDKHRDDLTRTCQQMGL